MRRERIRKMIRTKLQYAPSDIWQCDESGDMDCRNAAKRCTAIIDASLSRLVAGDTSGVCRTRRAGMAELKTLRRGSGNHNMYLGFLFEATEMIMESCRDLAVASGLPLWVRCELDLLRKRTVGCDQDGDSPSGQALRGVVDDVLKEHLSAMTEECWADNSREYRYLGLLQNLRTAAVCRNRIMKM